MNEENCGGELSRYFDDEWYFAMLLIDGTVLGFSTIYSESDDFYTIGLLQSIGYMTKAFGKTIECSATSRLTCKVRKSAVIAIQEIAET